MNSRLISPPGDTSARADASLGPTPGWVPVLVGLMIFGTLWLIFWIVGGELVASARMRNGASSVRDEMSFWTQSWPTWAPIIAVAVAGFVTALWFARRKRSAVYDATIAIERALTIEGTPDELYRMWRDPRVLDRIFAELADVTALDARRQRWVLKGPKDWTWSWASVLSGDTPGQHIAWRTEGGCELPNHGSVRFDSKDGARTEVHLAMTFVPAEGAKILAEVMTPGALHDVLRRFKSLVETGAIGALERSAESG